MTVLAVPCNKTVILTQQQGEELLREVNSRKLTKEQRERINTDAKELRRKPEKR